MTDDERWAAGELKALRARRFRPSAWAHFVGESRRRASATRNARPALARQARIWSAAGLGAGTAACAWASRTRIPSPRPARWALRWLATSAMLDWHLGMVESPTGKQREKLSAADALTLSRIALVPPLAAQGDPAQPNATAFAVLLTTAAATDTLDGALARRAGASRLGRDLDTVADALTAATGARAAWRAGWLPAGVVGLTVARGAVPIAIVTAGYFRTGRRPPIESTGATRQLAPALLGGLAAAPFAPRTGAALTSAASIAALALSVRQPDRRSAGFGTMRRGSRGQTQAGRAWPARSTT